MELQINYAAIVVAVVANFILGFIWYTPLFGKAWAKEMGFDTSIKPSAGQLAKGLTITIIGTFLMVYVFAHNIAAWSFVPGTDEMGAGGTILNAAIFTWLGFFVPLDLERIAWEKGSWKLFAINGGYHLMTLLVAASILILW